MAHYAIAFDLNTKRMKKDGLSASQITKIYKTETKEAFKKCGFTVRAQGSLYRTSVEQDQIKLLIDLRSNLQSHAPLFCKYVEKLHVFRMDDWSDITESISTYTPPAEADDSDDDDYILDIEDEDEDENEDEDETISKTHSVKK
jgi:virulence-associated protein VapD